MPRTAGPEPIVLLRLTFVVLILVTIPSINSAQTAAQGILPDQILLKDFRPRVIYKVPHTNITRARFPAIDVHAHPRYARTPEQVDRWVRTMDDLGLDRTVLLTETTGKRFDEVVARYAKHRFRFLVWCGFDLT